MRIAIFGTNYTSTPPPEKRIYAPLWVAWYLAEGLKKMGHKVFLFASADSKTKAQLISNGLVSFEKNKAWNRADKKLSEQEKLIMRGQHQYTWAVKWKEVLRGNYELLLASKLCEMAQEGMFDVVQFHSPLRVLHFAALMGLPVFFTMHDPLLHPFGSGTVKTIAGGFKARNIKFVSISKAQRKNAPELPWAGTIYNGVDPKRFQFRAGKGGYLAFAGRIVPQKGLDVAVRVAHKTRQRLKIVGPVRKEHNSYWREKIKPYLSKTITYEGLLTSKQMASFYQNGKALLMPIQWSEPFGLVMTEAQACGTPVIAFNKGAAREIVKHGKTGFIVKNEKEMAKAIQRIDEIKREDCREWVEKKFSIERMVSGYEKIYLKALNH